MIKDKNSQDWKLVNGDKLDFYESIDLIELNKSIDINFKERLKALQYVIAFRDFAYLCASFSKEDEKSKFIYFMHYSMSSEYIYDFFGFVLDLYMLNVLLKGNNFIPIQYVNDETDGLLFRSINYFYYSFLKGILWDLDKHRFINEKLSLQRKVLGLSFYSSTKSDNYYLEENYLNKNIANPTYGLDLILNYLLNSIYSYFRYGYLIKNFEKTTNSTNNYATNSVVDFINNYYIDFSNPIKDYTCLDFQENSLNKKLYKVNMSTYSDLFILNKKEKNKSLYVDKSIKFEFELDINQEIIKNVFKNRNNLIKEYLIKNNFLKEKEYEESEKLNYYFLRKNEEISKFFDKKYSIKENINSLYENLKITSNIFVDSFLSEKTMTMNIYYIYYLSDLYFQIRNLYKIQKNKFVFFDIKQLKISTKKI